MSKQLFHSTSQTIRTILIILCLIGMVFVQVAMDSSTASLNQTLFYGSLVRILGGVAFLLIMFSFGYSFLRPFQKPFLTILIIVIPGWLVAINNLPWIALFSGNAEVTEGGATLWLFILDCLSVGFFEELIFRGVILVVLLQRLPQTKRGTVQAVFLSAGIFALVHLFNLFAGAGVADTLLQVSYSFGMGLLWAVVFLATGSIWSSVLLHAGYNFTGLLFVTLGSVHHRYDVITILLTVLFALIAAYSYLKLVLALNRSVINDLITPQ